MVEQRVRPATSILPTWLVRLFAFFGYVFERFRANQGMERAAALTYTTLFAVVPLMTVAYSMLSVVSAFQGVTETVQDFVFDNFVPQAGAVVSDKLSEFSSQARQLTGVGVLFLVVTAYMMLVNIERAFNDIWGVTEPRKGMGRFLLYWGILTLAPLLLGISIVISSYLFSLPLIADPEARGLREVLLGVLPFVLSTGAFTVLFSAVPNTRVPLRDAMLGGVLTMLAFEVAKYVFAFVVRQTSVEVIYGTFAAVPLFLTWLYLTWMIVLLGAHAVQAMGVRRYGLLEGQGAAYMVAMAFLERVHRQHQLGGGLPEVLARPVLLRLGPDILASVVDGLQKANIIGRDADGNWLPRRDFDVVTAADVYRALPGARLALLGDDRDVAPWRDALRQRIRTVTEQRDQALGITLAELFATPGTLHAAGHEAADADPDSSDADTPDPDREARSA